jgi:hypothetical protein
VATDERSVHAAAYCNGDDVFLAWILPHTDDCWGAAIWRDHTRGTRHHAGFLDNRVGFADDDPEPHSHRPSTEWPFQRYTWTDHGVDEGDTVSYRIIPMLKPAAGSELVPDDDHAATVGPITVTGKGGGDQHAYFNRGILLSQFVARRLPPEFTEQDLLKLKDDLENEGDQLRAFLTGQLGARLLELLDEAKASGGHVFAALYELDDPALVARLKTLGAHAHLVLSNGSKKKKGADGNAEAAAALEHDVDLHRRMLWSEGLGHNKFLVVTDAAKAPLAVWTGSTNWATTGLCTQLNNAILVEDAELAGVYLEQWTRLRDDHRTGRQGQPMHFDEPLLDSNDVPKRPADGSDRWTVWFTRTTLHQDMDAAAELINGAEHAILFLMFEPGKTGLLQVVQARLSTASSSHGERPYVHGVVNTLKRATDGDQVAVDLVARGHAKSFDLDVVEPEGVHDLPGWATEVTRRDFLLNQGGSIGHAIIHSKVIVLDPFTNPVVITGSHNFSAPASVANDENLIVLRDAMLAQRYAVQIMSSYQHYRWRAYLQDCARQHRSPWKGLVKGDTWQQKRPAHDRELEFWVR